MLDISQEFPLISSEAPRVRSDELIAAYAKCRPDELIAAYARWREEDPLTPLTDRELKNQAEAEEVVEALRLTDARFQEMHDQQAAQLEAQRNSERAAIAQSLEKAVNSRADKDLATITSLLKTPDVHLSRAALIAKHRQAWPTIETDLNHADTNGLNECKAKDPVTGELIRDQWIEAPCLSWAKMKGKYFEAGKGLASIFSAPTTKSHRNK